MSIQCADKVAGNLSRLANRVAAGQFTTGTGHLTTDSILRDVLGILEMRERMEKAEVAIYQLAVVRDMLRAAGCPWDDGCHIPTMLAGWLLEGKEKPMQTFHQCVEQPQRGPTANHEFYRPQESPTRYPLELGPEGNICLWEPQGRHKITIAYLYADKEGDFDLRFVGDRPLDKRVNWDHFRECVEQGFALMRGKR